MAVPLSPFVGQLTPDVRLFAGAVIAVLAVNAVRPLFATVGHAQRTNGIPLHELHPFSSQVMVAYVVAALTEKTTGGLKED